VQVGKRSLHCPLVRQGNLGSQPALPAVTPLQFPATPARLVQLAPRFCGTGGGQVAGVPSRQPAKGCVQTVSVGGGQNRCAKPAGSMGTQAVAVHWSGPLQLRKSLQAVAPLRLWEQVLFAWQKTSRHASKPKFGETGNPQSESTRHWTQVPFRQIELGPVQGGLQAAGCGVTQRCCAVLHVVPAAQLTVWLVAVPAALHCVNDAPLAAHAVKAPGVQIWVVTQLPPWQLWPAGQFAFWN